MSDGTIEQLPNGRWRVRFRVGGRLRTLDTFDSEPQAEAYRRYFAERLTDSDSARDVTVADFGDKVLLRRELRGRIADPDSDRSRFEQHIQRDEIGRAPIRALDGDRERVLAWLERLEAKGLAEQTIRNCRTVLSLICEAAIGKRLLRANPLRGIRREPEKRTDDPWTYLTLEEQARVLDAARRRGIWEIIAFSIGSGLRAGELVSLRLEDVHLDDADPHLWVRYGGPPTRRHPRGEPPKWGRIRRVQLFGIAKVALEAWLPKLAGVRNPHGLAFPRLGGGRWDAGGYRDPAHVIPWESWKGASARASKRGKTIPAVVGLLEEAAITREFRWHDLRHTCGSSLVSGWWGRSWSLIEVRDLLGHRDIATTQRYAQLGETAAKAAAREADAAFHAVPRLEVALPDSSTIPLGATLGNRTPDLRFTKPSEIQANTSTCGDLERPWNTALALLEAAAAGEAARTLELGRALADGVLAAPLVALAVRARAGDVAAAIDLATAISDVGSAAELPAPASGVAPAQAHHRGAKSGAFGRDRYRMPTGETGNVLEPSASASASLASPPSRGRRT